MGFYIPLFALVIVICGFAVVTKPSEEALNKQVYAQILADAKSLKVNNEDNFISGVMKFACRISPEKCTQKIFHTMVTIRIDDKFLFKSANVNVFDYHASCIGVFNTWRCD